MATTSAFTLAASHNSHRHRHHEFKRREINDLQKWRRGWDLNSVAPYIPRKLLILNTATIAKTAQVAQVGYSFGTHSLLRWLLLLGFLLPFSAWAQTPFIPIVQVGPGTSGSTCVFQNPVVSGNILIATSTWFSSAGAVTVTDTRGSSYVQGVLSNAGAIGAATYVAPAASSGADTITFTVAGSSFQWTLCAEFPASAWTTTIDASDAQILSGTPASITSATLTTARNGDLIYASVGGSQSGGIFSIGSGYSWLGNQGGHDSAEQEFKVAGTNGGYTASFGTSVNTDVTLVTIALQSKPIAIQSPNLLPNGALSKAYNYTLLALGGTGSYTWSITSGSLQSGLSLNASTGAITGTPLSSSNNSITFRVNDGTNSATLATTLKIAATLNTPALVQTKGPPNNIGSTPTLAFTSPVTLGDVLLVAMEGGGVPCTDSVGTIYRHMYLDFMGASSNEASVNIQAGYAGGTGANTVTCAGVIAIMSLTELSNAQLFGIDNVAFNKGTSASPISSPTLTTLVPNEILYAVDTGVSSGTVLTAQAPFTDLGNFWIDAGYRAVTTVAGYSSSFTMTLNADGHWNTFLAGLRPSGGAVAPPVRHRAQVIRYRKPRKHKILLARARQEVSH